MKTKTLLFSGLLFISCETNVKQRRIQDEYYGDKFTILEVDSCEYIMIKDDSRSLTHKGNCMYCKERLEVLFKTCPQKRNSNDFEN